LFFGDRYGLTATVTREDGLEPIYQYHIGSVFHRDLAQELKPRIYFQAVPVQINQNDPAVRQHIFDRGGKMNIPLLRTYLGRMEENNRFIAGKLAEPLAHGRKVLALSHSKDQLKMLNRMFPESGLCTGDEAPADRLITLRNRQLTFGTLQLVKEALDEQTLDTLFFLSPFGSNAVDMGGKNTLQQGMGRILRYQKNKKTPVVVIMDYVNIPKFHRMCRKMKQLLHNWPTDEGGPFEYQLLRPYANQEII
jgi:superfamily II DNA or RNA helicase